MYDFILLVKCIFLGFLAIFFRSVLARVFFKNMTAWMSCNWVISRFGFGVMGFDVLGI